MIRLLTSTSTGTVHARSWSSPTMAACGREVVGEVRRGTEAEVTCKPCRGKPLHLPMYHEED